MAASMEHFAQLLVASSLSPQGWSTISEACSKFAGDASVSPETGYLQIGAHDYELLSQACSAYLEKFGEVDAKRQGYAPMDATSTTPASPPHDNFTTSISVSSSIVSTPNTYNYFAHSIPAYHSQSPPTPSNPYPTARNYYRASTYYPVPDSPPKRAPTFQRTFTRANDAPKLPSETTAGRVTTKARRFNPYSRPAPASKTQAPTTLPTGKFRLTGTNVLFDNADDTFRPSSLPPWKK